jgi:hypothetical protein
MVCEALFQQRYGKMDKEEGRRMSGLSYGAGEWRRIKGKCQSVVNYSAGTHRACAVCDEEHPSTLTSINNLAVLRDQGKYGQAGRCIGKHST